MQFSQFLLLAYLEIKMCNVVVMQITETFEYLPHDSGHVLLLKPFFCIKNPLQLTTCSSESDQMQQLNTSLIKLIPT